MSSRLARVCVRLVLSASLSVLGACAASPAAAPASATSPSAGSKSIDAAADDVIRRWNANDTDGLFATFNATMQAAVPRAKLAAIITRSRAFNGTITGKKRTGAGEADPTVGEYALDAERGLLTLTLALDDQGLISGLWIQPRKPNASSPPPPVAKSSIPMGLPVKGEWSVLRGGNTLDVNLHVNGGASQRRAVDLVRLGPDGSSHRSDGGANKDYYAYGEEIVAVADGTVVEAVDGVVENTPADRNTWVSIGNSVIVEHAPTLYSVYGHLQPGSVRVKAGDKVTRGQTLGLCGNTGNVGNSAESDRGSEPSLHFQLQDGPHVSKSWGVEPVFTGVTVTRDGKTIVVQDYSPLKGDRISQTGK